MSKYRDILQAELDAVHALEFELTDGIYPMVKQLPYHVVGALIREDNHHYPLGTAFHEYGLSGIASLAEKCAIDNSDETVCELYEGIAAVYQALCAKFAGFSAWVLKKMDSEDDANRKSRMAVTADMMKRLASGRPDSFRDALGLEYLIWLIRTICTGGACIGCFDRHLVSFYEKDIADGRLTDEEALGYLKEVWLGMNVRGSGDTLTNVVVGGMDAEGNDASSMLSVLMVRASIELSAYSEPHMTVRCHRKMRRDLFEAMLELQLKGGGQGTFSNDDIVLPALLRRGYTPETAAVYTPDGCTEFLSDGHSTITFNHIDAAGTFELAFNNGRYTEFERKPVPYFHKNNTPKVVMPDCREGFESGSFDEAENFEEVFEAFMRQYLYQLDNRMNELKEHHELWSREATGSLFANGTYSDVLVSGIGMFRGGLKETCYMVFAGSVPAAADCLAAVKKWVFDEKKYTISEIRKALEVNYVGYGRMQTDLKSAPKFGNDDDSVDLIAAEIVRRFCERTEEYSRKEEIRIVPALIGWKFLEEGYAVGPTPDGRNYGDGIAEHFNAAPGNAKSGPTAVLLSASKAPLSMAAGTAPIHISLPSGVFHGNAEGMEILRSLNEAAMKLGIMYFNVAIYNEEKLLDAQKHPERYEDLIVRVWGFSAKFIDLAREMQNHVISRIRNAVI